MACNTTRAHTTHDLPLGRDLACGTHVSDEVSIGFLLGRRIGDTQQIRWMDGDVAWKLAERMGAGRAMVLVTHQLEEAWDLADRVAVLVAGRWALQAPRAGAPAELLARYREALHA